MVWYFLGEEKLRGRGIISDAVRQVMVVAFGGLGLVSLYAWVMDGNAASQKVLLNNGFCEAGRLRQSVRCGDRQVDRIYYDVILPDWEGQDPRLTGNGFSERAAG